MPRTTTRLLAVAAAILVSAATPAVASADLLEDFERLLAQPDTPAMGHAPGSPSEGAPPASEPGTLGTEQGQDQGEGQEPSPLTEEQAPRKVRKCKRRHGRRICVTTRDGIVVKRCVTRAGRTRCKRPRRSGTLGTTSAISWQGWTNPVMQAVGKIAFVRADGTSSECSGTVVSRTLMLTAAHCVYTHEAGGYHTRILFAPGWTTTGAGVNGVWEARDWWVPTSYKRADGDMSQDYALVEFGPQNGRYIGDATGSWSIHFSQTWQAGRKVYLAGYPASGFWATSAGFNGNGQYACDSSYDGYKAIGSGYELWAACTMNGGASGGPWFIKLANGQWTIGGVNSQCDGPYANNDPRQYCQPYSYSLRSPFFDNRFLTFWNTRQ